MDRICLAVGCDKKAEFEIWDEAECRPDIGSTDSCEKHVGELLGSVPPTVSDSWRVITIKEE